MIKKRKVEGAGYVFKAFCVTRPFSFLRLQGYLPIAQVFRWPEEIVPRTGKSPGNSGKMPIAAGWWRLLWVGLGTALCVLCPLVR